MSDAIITVDQVGKKYRLQHQTGPRYTALRDVLAEKAASLFRRDFRSGASSSPSREDFWALRNVSFEVKPGEVLGIIGRNGAGKSTLLKILSRITEPTEGEIRLRGRVASLLEVGTGFHPELTGRENIYLNGAILGMSRLEIRRKFDEIVAFAEVEKFLDTAVKYYSSGMYMRLAFAVAAHLEPEILIVDEVLAVGDAQFQKKCLGKMQDVARTGRTVLFVSHNLAALGKLCSSAILLSHGCVQQNGPTDKIISCYLQSGSHLTGIHRWDHEVANGHDQRLKIAEIRILSPDAAATGHLDIRQSFSVEVTYEILQILPQFRIALKFVTLDGIIVFTASDSADPTYEMKSGDPGIYKTRCFVPGQLLNEGSYSLTLSADIPFQKVLFLEENVLDFFVEPTGGVNSRFSEKWPGVVCPKLLWERERLPTAS